MSKKLFESLRMKNTERSRKWVIMFVKTQMCSDIVVHDYFSNKCKTPRAIVAGDTKLSLCSSL